MIPNADPAINRQKNTITPPHSRPSAKLNEFALARRRSHNGDSLSRDERIAKMQIASVRDALKGGMNVEKKIRRATDRAVTSILRETARWELWQKRFSNTKTAASTLKAMVRQSLVLSSFAARRDYEKMIGSVVTLYDHSFVLHSTPNWKKEPLRRWRDLSDLEKYAWITSGMMQEWGRKWYVAFSLNLSTEDAAKSPAELKDPIRKRLGRALGREVEHMTMFCIEKDDKGRSHCHGIYFGSITEKQKDKLKQAGGQWDGKDSRYQRHTAERYGMEGAIGWGWYMHKNVSKEAEFCIPHELTRVGQSHYERVAALLLPHFIAERDTMVNQKATVKAASRKAKATKPQQTKVLEKTDLLVSHHENVGHQFPKTDANSRTRAPGTAKECPQDAPEAIKTSGGIIDGHNEIESLKTHHRSYRYVTARELEDAWQFKMEDRESPYQQRQSSAQLNDDLDALLEDLEGHAVL